MDTSSPLYDVILFDGVCNLCNSSVQFVIRRDRRARFKFAPLQSQGEAAGDSIVLVDNGRRYTRSTAALRIARHLDFPWNLAYALIVVPRPLRDAAYDFIARRRYRWFGRRDVCMTPTPELRSRFLPD